MNDNGKFLVGLAAGIGIGTILGLLIAPEKGSETYKKIEGAIKNAANDLMEYGTEAMKAVREGNSLQENNNSNT